MVIWFHILVKENNPSKQIQSKTMRINETKSSVEQFVSFLTTIERMGLTRLEIVQNL